MRRCCRLPPPRLNVSVHKKIRESIERREFGHILRRTCALQLYAPGLKNEAGPAR
jgi:hypothetical protein